MPKKRRGNGEGSIYQRKDGLWVGQYKVQSYGEKKTKYLYGKTRAEVTKKLTKAIADRDSGLFFDCCSLTLEQYLDKWLDSTKGTIKDGAFRRYEEVSRIHIKPNLGCTKLDRVTALQLQSLYRSKLDSGLSPRTVQIIHTTLHKSPKQAVK